MHSTDCSLQFYTFLNNKTDKIPGTGLTLILQIIAITWPVVKKTSTTTSFKVLCASETTLLLEILNGILTSEGYSGSWRGDGRAQSRHLPESSSRKKLGKFIEFITCYNLWTINTQWQTFRTDQDALIKVRKISVSDHLDLRFLPVTGFNHASYTN